MLAGSLRKRLKTSKYFFAVALIKRMPTARTLRTSGSSRVVGVFSGRGRRIPRYLTISVVVLLLLFVAFFHIAVASLLLLLIALYVDGTCLACAALGVSYLFSPVDRCNYVCFCRSLLSYIRCSPLLLLDFSLLCRV